MNMNELQGDLNRLEIAEKLSRMEAYEENPFKFKPQGWAANPAVWKTEGNP